MLPKKQRLRLKKDFKKIFDLGKTLSNRLFVLKFIPNELKFCRGAIIIQAKKVSKAVARNKIKRTVSAILSDVFSKRDSALRGIDAVIIIQSPIERKKSCEIKESLLEIFKKANIV